MNKERLYRLLDEYFSNTISPEDGAVLLEYIGHEDGELLSDVIDELLKDKQDGPDFKGVQAEKVFNQIITDPRYTKRHFSRHRWLSVAAIFLVCMSFGLYFNFLINKDKNPEQRLNASADSRSIIIPGSTKATLTLAGGKKIILDDVPIGEVAKQSGISITKNKKGKIVYHVSETPAPQDELLLNKIETPKGGEYQVVLPDGTKVWLNSASSISFPTRFSDKQRAVNLSGEGYFEVARDVNKPFKVTAGDVLVQVLGTHFNIASYKDEEVITTTLLEGSVKIYKNQNSALLKPGQQAAISYASSKIEVSQANVGDAMAWRNGYFRFQNEDIKSIMRKLSRWYNIEVEYSGNIGGQKFGGTFYRNKSFDELLNYLEKIGNVHFKVKGRRVIVIA